ncbi:S-adenosylmethionine:tRNA ribosyltransferase-isomerase [Chloroflexota bacterium]
MSNVKIWFMETRPAFLLLVPACFIVGISIAAYESTDYSPNALHIGLAFLGAFVTLHVGLDSFRPVRVEDMNQHQMHQEYGELTEGVASKLSKAKAEGRRVVCVGTTTVRLLEQAALAADEPEMIKPFKGWTSLFISPGHQFRLVDSLITNFHLPRSTLLMLVCAFAGKELIDRAYQEAINSGYRFYSFGDGMMIL